MFAQTYWLEESPYTCQEGAVSGGKCGQPARTLAAHGYMNRLASQ